MEVPRLFLVDGMSHIYRAYYAIKRLTNKGGLSTNATYGFTVMLGKLISDEEPDFLGVAFDLPGPTIRHEKFEAYKATRPRMPDDLSDQIPYIKGICEALQVPLLSYERFEADDVIGTLAAKAVAKGLEVVIVSVDKDLLQLVSDQVTVLDTRSMTWFDPAKVSEKWGVRPDQVVDVLSLVGDSSDNIPGAPGIGEKGAKSLISQYGTLDNLLDHREEVPRKSYRESLQKNEELIRQSRQLIQIQSEVPLDLNLEELRLTEPNFPKLRKIFRDLNFSRLLDELPAEQPPVRVELTHVKTANQLGQVAKKVSAEKVGVAMWTDESDPLFGSPQGISLSCEPGKAFFLSGEFLRENPEDVATLLSQDAEWAFHDLKRYILAGLERNWRWGGSRLDTMLMAYLLDPNNRDFSLVRLSEEYLQVKMRSDTKELSLLSDDRPQDLGEKAAATVQLCRKLYSLLEEQGLLKLLLEMEIPLVEVLAKMERLGVRVDTRLLEQMSRDLGGVIDEIEAKVWGLAGEEFNLNSPKQLSYILFERLELPARKKAGKAGHYSTGVEVLEELSAKYEIAGLILEYRELAKLRNTYLDALPKLVNARTGRIHTSYNQMVAATGRLSSSNPNLQNIPIRSEIGRGVRRAFIPKEGYKIMAADYSQIELRVMAHLSEDPVLLDSFRRGEDIHERTALEVFGETPEMDIVEKRRRAKVINFGIIYGLSAFGLARSLKITRSEAQKFIDDYFIRYRGFKAWTERILMEAEESGHVRTLFGRIRQIPEIKSRNRNLREFAKRTAVNAPIQGTAADLIKMAMTAIHQELKKDEWKSQLIMQVHDELVFEVEPSEVESLTEMVVREMETVVELLVPLKVDVALGASWFEAK